MTCTAVKVIFSALARVVISNCHKMTVIEVKVIVGIHVPKAF